MTSSLSHRAWSKKVCVNQERGEGEGRRRRRNHREDGRSSAHLLDTMQPHCDRLISNVTGLRVRATVKVNSTDTNRDVGLSSLRGT